MAKWPIWVCLKIGAPPKWVVSFSCPLKSALKIVRLFSNPVAVVYPEFETRPLLREDEFSVALKMQMRECQLGLENPIMESGFA